jgi:hypothetical protein
MTKIELKRLIIRRKEKIQEHSARAEFVARPGLGITVTRK